MKYGYKLIVQVQHQKQEDDGQIVAESQTSQFTPAMTIQAFDAMRDFVPIAHVLDAEGLLVVHPSVPVRDLKELIAFAKEKPDALSSSRSSRWL